MPDCPRLNRIFCGCKWQAQYDTREPVRSDCKFTNLTETAVIAVSTASRTYAGSLCITCGKTQGVTPTAGASNG